MGLVVCFAYVKMLLVVPHLRRLTQALLITYSYTHRDIQKHPSLAAPHIYVEICDLHS